MKEAVISIKPLEAGGFSVTITIDGQGVQSQFCNSKGAIHAFLLRTL